MVGFGIVINPYSRRMRRKGAFAALCDLARHYEVPMAIPLAGSLVGPEIYRRPLATLLDKGIDVLLVCSGDGGHHLIDTALFSLMKESEMPAQANIRGGTMNVRAESAGLSRRTIPEMFYSSSSEHLFRAFLETYREKDISELPVVGRRLLRISVDGKELVGFAYSSGFTVPFFERYYELGGYHTDAFRVILEIVLSLPFSGGLAQRFFEGENVGLSLDGTLAGHSYKGILALAQDVRMDFGVLELSVAELQGVNNQSRIRLLASQRTSPLEMLGQVPRLFSLRGSQPHHFKIDDLVCRDVSSVSIDGGHDFLVDGDLYSTSGGVSLSLSDPVRYAVV